MVELKENFCDIVGNKSNSYLLQMIRQAKLNINSNFFEPCLLMMRFTVSIKIYFIIHNLSYFLYKWRKYRYEILLGTTAFPPLMPIGEWKLITKLVTYMNVHERSRRAAIFYRCILYEISRKTAIQF